MTVLNGKNKRGREASSYSTKRDLKRRDTVRYGKRRIGAQSFALVLCLVLVICVVAASAWHFLTAERPQKDRQDELAESIIAANTGSGEEEPLFEEVTLEYADASKGDLILVNFEHEYVFPETEDHLVNIFSNKTADYGVAYNDYVLDGHVLEVFSEFMAALSRTTEDRSVLINSTYRSLEEQQSIYDSYVQSNGEEYAKKYVADPGCSEHHTGLALDLTIRYADGTYELMKNYEHLEALNSIAPTFGFIQRYPENKYSFTHINTEPWHYRYVGVPHAYVIAKNKLCLEEYVTMLRDYTADGEMLLVDAQGDISSCDRKTFPENGYVIYHVPALEDGRTAVPVPIGADNYTVSGDNCGAFVVAALFGEVELPAVTFAVPGVR